MIIKRNNFSLENFNVKTEQDISNIQKEVAVIFIDIYEFSKKIKVYNSYGITLYLKKFYDIVLPIINGYGGKIEKIMGDGIIAVFSDLFNKKNNKDNIFENAYNCCKHIIEYLSNNCPTYESKAAISKGNVLFYKINDEAYDYYEVTCIGEPLTEVYRLENIAEKNEILFFENVPENFDSLIEDTDSYRGWLCNYNMKDNFKGLGKRIFNRVKYKSE
ncbi:hypothetical protein R4K48_07695 [Brachyspira pulli]|uniref:hypothetical protein n=1 Tax=Brachyspira pulli TaxID=310721 RepID=UPI0030075442